MPDVRGKPYFEDESLAALIAMRPLGEMLDTVLLDRGGAPLHFLLAHLALRIEMSGDALRWLSIVAALAAIPVCFDLGRRLGGNAAGLIAAVVTASSTALAIYGTFGRMYSLFVLVAALFADLYVRALRKPTTGAVAAAAAAGWLLPAVHPYGVIPAVAAMAAAAVVWRGRPLRAAWPVALSCLAAIPFVVADLRLADRATVGSGTQPLATPHEAWVELSGALASFAGGDGLPYLFFAALATGGFVLIARRDWPVVVVAASVAVPPALFLVLQTDSPPDLSPRHLFYALPLWAAAIGVAVARFPIPAMALVALVAITSPPSALREPRRTSLGTALPGEAPPVRAARGDVLIPYSPLFLESLADVRHALVLPHAPAEEILAVLDNAEEPIDSVQIAVPLSGWKVLAAEGPFTKAEALEATARLLRDIERRDEVRDWLRWIEPALCDALRELDNPCP